MGVVRKMRKQYAVYWERTGNDRHGNPKFAEATEVRCRWSEKQEEYRDADGVQRFGESGVFVDRSMPLGSWLWKGRIADVENLTTPEQNEKAGRIVYFKEVPNLKNTETLFKAVLAGSGHEDG